jgi:2-(1,2-epoxy-1,2-dihydrophenyl)acetyl-CoA isomerase
MTEPAVLLTKDGPIATITLNRPAAGNTVNMPLAQGLLDAAIDCDEDPAIRCVILTANGKLFCGGGDLSAFAAVGDAIPDFLANLAGTLNAAVIRLMKMPKPLVTLVNGPAAGAGLSLSLVGDIVIAAKSAHFTAAYTQVGLTPDGGMSWLLPRVVGLRRAQEIILSNRRILAEEAAEIGLVTRAIADVELPLAGQRQARAFAEGPTAALGGARALLLSSFDHGLEAQLTLEALRISQAGATPECREGVSAFGERRKPDFLGKA